MIDIAATRLTLILIASFCLQACIVLPEPGEERVFVGEEKIAAVRVGQTNNTDLQKTIGSPDWSLSDGSRWAYHTRDYRPAGIAVLSEGYTGSLMNWRSEFLYVKFNSSNVVDNVEVSVVEPDPVDGWSRHEITDMCLEAYGTPLLYGSASEDADSKRFLTEPDKCAVYLYTETTILPFLIGTELMDYARCPPSYGYIRFDLESGVQEIAVISDNYFARDKYTQTPIEEKVFSETIEFDCTPGDIFFVREHFGSRDDFSFQFVPDEEGRRNIAARSLVLVQEMGLWSPPNLSTP